MHPQGKQQRKIESRKKGQLPLQSVYLGYSISLAWLSPSNVAYKQASPVSWAKPGEKEKAQEPVYTCLMLPTPDTMYQIRIMIKQLTIDDWVMNVDKPTLPQVTLKNMASFARQNFLHHWSTCLQASSNPTYWHKFCNFKTTLLQ